MKPFKKTINPGSIPVERDRERMFARVTCVIAYADKEDGKRALSVTGKIGEPYGSGGQIEMSFRHRTAAYDDARYTELLSITRFNKGWTSDLWLEFLDRWHEWHLNDMRAGCEHQRKLPGLYKRITTADLSLSPTAWASRRRIIKAVEASLREHGKAAITAEERRVLALPLSLEIPHGDGYPPPPGDYEIRKIKKETANWVRADVHPEGMLLRKCPECGYEYGSRWLYEPVPEDVLEFLKGLP